MSYLRISVANSGVVLAQKVKQADNFYTRLMGLMFTEKMDGYDGILFQPGNSIHTCFMRYPIDVVFLGENNEVVKVVHSMRPWRFTKMYLRAKKALELMAGTVPTDVKEGTRLEVSYV